MYRRWGYTVGDCILLSKADFVAKGLCDGNCKHCKDDAHTRDAIHEYAFTEIWSKP
jgi:hypothetical protein